MGLFSKFVPKDPAAALERGPVPAGKTRICVAGFAISHNVGSAATLTRAIITAFPETYESWFYFDNQGFRNEKSRFFGKRGTGGVLKAIKESLPEDQLVKHEGHMTAPFCWLEYPGGRMEALGGRDDLCEWARSEFKDEKQIVDLATGPPKLMEATFDTSLGTAQLN